MNWSEIRRPNDGYYTCDHLISHTPLGPCVIELEYRKENLVYLVYANYGSFVGKSNDLDEAKNIAKNYFIDKTNELLKFLELDKTSLEKEDIIE